MVNLWLMSTSTVLLSFLNAEFYTGRGHLPLTAFFQPPLPARKCSGSSSVSSGRTLPVRGGTALRDGVPPDVPPDVPPLPSSRRRPPQPESESPIDFYLSPSNSVSSVEVCAFNAIRRYINPLRCF